MKQNLKEVIHNSNIFLCADPILTGPILKCGYYTQCDFSLNMSSDIFLSRDGSPCLFPTLITGALFDLKLCIL